MPRVGSPVRRAIVGSTGGGAVVRCNWRSAKFSRATARCLPQISATDQDLELDVVDLKDRFV